MYQLITDYSALTMLSITPFDFLKFNSLECTFHIMFFLLMVHTVLFKGGAYLPIDELVKLNTFI
jgi:hypothetical protein